MARKDTLFNQLTGDLNPSALNECKRLWDLRDDLPGVNDVTLPLLVQYAATWAKANSLSAQLGDAEGEQLDNYLEQLSKAQKLLINYAKVLKLDNLPAKKSKNKFAELLLGGQ